MTLVTCVKFYLNFIFKVNFQYGGIQQLRGQNFAITSLLIKSFHDLGIGDRILNRKENKDACAICFEVRIPSRKKIL